MSETDVYAQNLILAQMRGALSPEDERIVSTMENVESQYIRTHNDEPVEREIALLVRATVRSTRTGHALIVVGESGVGKSTVVNYHLDKHPSLRVIKDNFGNTLSPLVRVKAPADCTMRGLGITLLNRLGYPLKRDLDEGKVFELVRERLQLTATKIVFVDEFQHVLDAPKVKGVRHLTDTLKNLLQDEDWPVYLIVAGLPETANVVHRDPKEQMEGRTVLVVFEELTFKAHRFQIADSVRHLVSVAGLQLAVEPDDDFVTRFLHASRNRLGLIVRMIYFAIEDALERQEQVISHVHWERAYMRLAKRGRNVFSDPHWWTIRRGVMRDGTLGPAIEEAEEPQATTPRRKKRT